MNHADVHLSTEALAAFVDGELARTPRARADEHILSCTECYLAVSVQRQSKVSLTGSSCFDVPSSLMARLSAIPFAEDGAEMTPPGSSLSLSSSGAFQFSVAAPATKHARRTGTTNRHRVVSLGAAFVALGVGLAVGPSLAGARNGDVVPMQDELSNQAPVGVWQPNEASVRITNTHALDPAQPASASSN